MKKWIRCTVDMHSYLSDQRTAILWAIDYGAPLHTTNFDHIVPIPFNELISFPPSKIFKAGLGVLPAQVIWDSSTCKEVKRINNEWNERSVSDFKKWIAEGEKRGALFKFTPSSKFGGAHHHIGDLLVYHNDILIYGMNLKLLKADHAEKVDDGDTFHRLFIRLKTIDRWNDNACTGGVLKQPEGMITAAPLVYDNLHNMETEFSDEDYMKAVNDKVLRWQQNNEKAAVSNGLESDACSSVLSQPFGNKKSKELSRRKLLMETSAEVEFTPDRLAEMLAEKDLMKGQADEEFYSASQVGPYN